MYLSGNGPLVRVLQDALQDAGGAGQTFVRAIKSYVGHYLRRRSAVPPEHLIVFDEAQRAHDAERVAYVQNTDDDQSEPEHLLHFCQRIPRWNVLVALIGTGQAIHVGEEIGVPLWRQAIDAVSADGSWKVHCAANLAEHFVGGAFELKVSTFLNLDTELRFHLARDLHRFVEALLGSETGVAQALAAELDRQEYRLLITRDLEVAKAYLRDRYGESPLARYGLLASSKDKLLPRYGVDNTYQTTKRLREGPWYNSPPSDPRSCCQLNDVATEFASQGLELDCALVAWGSDLRRVNGKWSDDLSGGYQHPVRDRLALRKNVYRVLLTRGRDGSVVFVPQAAEMEETWSYLAGAGFRHVT